MRFTIMLLYFKSTFNRYPYFRTYVTDNSSDDADNYSIGKGVVTEVIGNSYEELRIVSVEDDKSSASPLKSIGNKKR